jgi:ribose/xylose/arabinose/galactoside ABC-type transport system permease subunit
VAFVNQFSFLILAVAAAVVGVAWLLRGPGSRARQIAAVLLLAVLTIAFFLLHPGRDEQSAPAAEARLAAAGQPILLEVYSDY